jgi:hypothetical protein
MKGILLLVVVPLGGFSFGGDVPPFFLFSL